MKSSDRMQIMITHQTLSIHHMLDLISLSPIVILMKISFHYYTAVTIDLKTQSLRSYRTTPQLLRLIDSL